MAEQIEFQLTLIPPSGTRNFDIEGELTSPLLTKSMHPSGKIPVNITTEGRRMGKREGFILDVFLLDSLGEYLRLQQYVTQTLEKELPNDRKRWDPNSENIQVNIWSSVEVVSLDLRQRNVPTSSYWQSYRKKGIPDEDIRKMVEASDTPRTRTFFRLILRCDWDQEHLLEALFRDGNFIGLDH